MAPDAMTTAPIVGAGSGPGSRRGAAGPDPAGEPDAIADAIPHLAGQPRGARSHEIDLGPWTERS